MTVLVTGGAGYIGSHMVLRLADAGQAVVVLDNLTTGFDWAIDHRATFVEGNAGDMELVGKLIAAHGITEIVHFAGSIVVPESVSDPLKYYANNTATSRNLIEAAVKGGVKHFIFSSTAAVYGNAGLEPVAETSQLMPESPYGRSKLMTELMLADVAAAHPLTYGVLRYFNVAGADPRKRSGQSSPTATHLIKVASQAALGQRPSMGIFGTDFPTPDGTGVRDYIHVSDLVEAHALLLDYLRKGGASVTMNCGYGRGFSVRDVVRTVKAVSGVDFKVVEEPRRAGDPASIVARADKVRQVLGWKPAHEDLTEIVDAALNWERYLATRNR
ncbi:MULTISPECIES: UDP-glucose 4-epimerase GalE [unclassified Devosia]|uniref:UDP-glucose 4-epimerase GalE n=1 Tax=unclassified Devosia TaxID=196773 RepID=UPI00086BE62A|nr:MULTISPECIES: UDP-glucose 4-epimerase GalE [unclassified Devosia]MBN9363389.1 UDP-glucose 4-epimerase GalE [Devosia sp.]ODS95212.1 MAG: UDP-glucose 4-epimerase GalE [Devosia sp. SCN 66-27]OJX25215.1 MAG: UDP-glucose 4-epimerase GalE [Devosia sp. 66-14]